MRRMIHRLTQKQCETSMPTSDLVPVWDIAGVKGELRHILHQGRPDKKGRLGRIKKMAAMAAQLENTGAMVKYRAKWYGDGYGLYLVVSSPNDPPKPGENRPIYRSWVFRWAVSGQVVVSKNGKARRLQRRIGLGPLATVPLARARELADLCRRQLQEGRDPLLVRKGRAAEHKMEQRRLHTLSAAVEEYWATHRQGWTAKHALDWKASFLHHLKPLLDLPVSKIDRASVVSTLKPIITSQIGRKLRGRLFQVLEMATANSWRDGENPAQWSHLKHSLPSHSQPVKRHDALKYQDAPEFMRRLRAVEGLTARATELLVLTGVRVAEVCAMRPEQLDLVAAVWTVPAQSTKTGKRSGQDHIVPLSDAAVSIIRKIEMTPGQPLFPIDDHAPNRLAKRLWTEYPIGAHGFRSTVRTFAASETDYAWEIGEAVLDHSISNDVAKRYIRTTWLDQRRALLQDYATFLSGGASGESMRPD
jgi:integrase